jgi:YD repeat-containing protein
MHRFHDLDKAAPNSLGGAIARTARCLLAVLLCSWVLVYPAHSQSASWWAAAQNTNPNTICESQDSLFVAGCYLNAIGSGTNYFQPGYAPCGVAGDPLNGCIFFTGPSPENLNGSFEIFTAASQYWLNLKIPRCQVCSANSVGHPINPAVGNVFTTETDVEFAGSGAIAFRRFYNSADATGIDGVPGWRHSYGRSISTIYEPANNSYSGLSSALYGTPEDACTMGFAALQPSVSAWAGATATYNNGTCVLSSGTTSIGTVQIQSSAPLSPNATTAIEYDVIRDDGQTLRFTLQNGVINNQPGSSMSLAVTESGFTVTDDNDNVEVYNTAGALQSITSRTGVVQTISYDNNGLFLEAIDSFGNSVTVTRNSQGSIASVTANGGGQVQYAYDSAQRLATVTNLDGTTRGYIYGNSSFTNALTAEVDENGTQFSTWGYDAQERGTSTQEAGGAGAMTLVYNSAGSVTTTDALGAVRTFNYTRVGDNNRVSGITGSQCPTCQESASTTYDANGWVASRTDYNGNLTCYANDPIRGLELVRVEGLAAGSSCPTNLAGYTPGAGTTQRKISTTWSTSYRLPTLVTEATWTTAFSYDSSGNLLTRTITDTTVSPNVSRTWTYTYDAFGRKLTAQGPRTDVNSTRTFSSEKCASGSPCGQLQTVTDELGHVTTLNAYNAYGQPVTITDPNGVVTTLTYDARQRLTSRSTAGETTSFAYYPIGLLHTVTLPDGSALQYSYDGAHRLTQIADGLGNQIVYTLDALGNHIAESYYDPSNALTLARNQVFNSLSELYQQIGSAGTAAVTTTFGYDSNGNQISISAPLSRNTANQYDALNRLVQITDPGNGVTTLNYDVNDDLTAVIDPRSLTTGYAYNGFGNLIQQTSPDTGVTVNSYDSGGNLATSTDARSQTGTYTYDARNRVTQIAYGDQTITFGYDSGMNGVSRLTSAGDANHTLAWTYDALGRVIGKTQTVGTGSSAMSKSVGYTYTNGDLTSLVTPSGQTVTYGYTNGQVTSIAVNGTALLSQVLYEPFGPVTGWTWGNNTNEARVYDQDGNVTNLEAAEGFTYGYDSAFRITGITDTDNAALSQSYGYDALDRLTTATGTSLIDLHRRHRQQSAHRHQRWAHPHVRLRRLWTSHQLWWAHFHLHGFRPPEFGLEQRRHYGLHLQRVGATGKEVWYFDHALCLRRGRASSRGVRWFR